MAGPLWPGVWGPPTGDATPAQGFAPSGADAPAGRPWGGANLYGGHVYNVINPPSPRVTQTGSWSEPYFPADEGQYGDALEGAKAIRDYWASEKGGVYNVDPKTMGMESGTVQGALSVTPDGSWSVKARLWPQKSGQYDLNAQDGDNWFDNAP